VKQPRSRRALLALFVLVLALGGISRLPAAGPLIQLYCGDVLWGALFFLLFAWLSPQRSSLGLGVLAVATTELIELSQLCRGDAALRLRATYLGGLLLGHQFLWSDVVCVFVGAAGAAVLDAAAQRFKASRW